MARGITKAQADKLMKIPGTARGVVFQIDYENIMLEHKDEFKKVTNKLKKLGHPIDYQNIKATTKYPIGLRMLSLIVMKQELCLTKKDIKKLGRNASRISFFIRLLIKMFVTIDSMVKKAPDIWTRHFDVGSLKAHHLNKKKKEVYVTIKDFKIHPIYNEFIEGYIESLVKLIMPNKKVKAKMIENPFKKGKKYEFKVTWGDNNG